MAMTQAQFDTLVADLERAAERSPRAYRFKLGAFATLGYVYVFGVLLVLLGVVAALGVAMATGKAAILIKLAIPVVVLAGIVLKSLWVKLEPPRGLVLEPTEYPRLFATIDEVRRAAKAPRAHVVLLTSDLNAAIVQIPRLGLFGWQKNYLILGLPLLEMLSLDEFKAVLAHEFGHLSGAHGSFGAWIYRVRAGWSRLSDSLQREEHWGRFLFVPFFDWYAPQFAAYSFVAARQQEHEADSLAAETVGAEPLANALVRLNLKGEELERDYWPAIFKAADDHPSPAGAPYDGLLKAERRGFVPDAGERLRQALQRATSTADTHPCLADRMASLGRPATLPPPFAVSAAEALLGAGLTALVAHFDREWQSAVADWWRGRHEHVKNGRERLAALTARPRASLSDVELYEYGRALEEFEGEDPAFDIYRTLVVDKGAARGAKYAYARLLLKRGDESGIALLDEVMREAPEATCPACELIVGYLHSRGRSTEAQPYIDRYHARQEVEQRAQVERERIRVSDQWVPAALSAESRAALETVLARYRKDIKAAYLVRKRLPDGEPALHVVGVLRRAPFYKLASQRADEELVNRLASEIRTDEDIRFIWLNGEQKTFIKPFKKVARSRLA